jgi:hypothetical protein
MVCRTMMATAPWPHDLEDLCKRARCWNWKFSLSTNDSHDGGLVTGTRLVIHTYGEDAYHPGRPRPVQFHFPIPACTFDRASWTRWLLDRIKDVQAHETGEALHFVYQRENTDGEMVEVAERPFAPLHGPGRDPHRFYEAGIPYSEVRVTQSGERYPGYWWDGGTVHSDAEHSACEIPCVPVQLMESSDAV